jgi:transposase
MDMRVTKRPDTRRRHSDVMKRALVERSLVPGASVSAIAQEAGINANLLFNWRRLHLRSQLPDGGDAAAPVLLPVTLTQSPVGAAMVDRLPAAAPLRAVPPGSIELEINGARVRLRGAVDEASLRTVLRALANAS